MTKWLAWQIEVLVARVRAPHEMQVFSAVQGHCTDAFYDAITGHTKFIISIVNSLKIVKMPEAWQPLLKEGNSLGILLLLKVRCWYINIYGFQWYASS